MGKQGGRATLLLFSCFQKKEDARERKDSTPKRQADEHKNDAPVILPSSLDPATKKKEQRTIPAPYFLPVDGRVVPCTQA